MVYFVAQGPTFLSGIFFYKFFSELNQSTSTVPQAPGASALWPAATGAYFSHHYSSWAADLRVFHGGISTAVHTP